MQEKRKKFWIVFSVTVLVLLSFTFLFGMITNLKTVNVDFKQRLDLNRTNLEENILEKVKRDGDFEYGKGLLFVNVDKSIEKIEKQNPFVKVHQVLTKFPNILNVYIIEREPCYYSKSEGFYMIFDKEFKLLDKFEADSDGVTKFETKYLKYVAEIDYNFSVFDLEAGDFAVNNGDLDIYSDVYLGVWGSLESFSKIKSIKVENSKVLITMKKDVVDFDDGVVIEFEGFKDAKLKTWVGIEAFKELDKNKQIDVIRIEKNPNNSNGYYANLISNND